MNNLTYEELISFENFEDRVKYLCLSGIPYEQTFGEDRYLNQMFYKSYEWLHDIRPKIILRDQGCDLAHPDYLIPEKSRLLIHHINPINADDLLNHTKRLTDPNNLVCVSYDTHNIIHYGNPDLAILELAPRRPNDTIPWR